MNTLACKHQKKQIQRGERIGSDRDVTKNLLKVKIHANNETSERLWVQQERCVPQSFPNP